MACADSGRAGGLAAPVFSGAGNVLWTKPLGLKTFRNTPDKAAVTRVLAANQGLYNGFLAAGLIWGLCTAQRNVVLFFLGCVIVAGLYGAYSVNKRIFFVQGVPAIAAMAAVFATL